MIKSNIFEVMNSVTKATDKLDTGARMARDEMMNTLTRYAKEEIKGRRQPGERAITGEPPMNRTGNLRRSIKGEKVRLYGRSVEMGGQYAPKTWLNGQKFPYMKPAFEKFQKVAMSIMRKHLSLRG